MCVSSLERENAIQVDQSRKSCKILKLEDITLILKKNFINLLEYQFLYLWHVVIIFWINVQLFSMFRIWKRKEV